MEEGYLLCMYGYKVKPYFLRKWWTENKAPLHSFLTTFEPKPDKIFDSLFSYNKMMQLFNIDPMGKNKSFRPLERLPINGTDISPGVVKPYSQRHFKCSSGWKRSMQYF
jgi:hypothetical protein